MCGGFTDILDSYNPYALLVVYRTHVGGKCSGYTYRDASVESMGNNTGASQHRNLGTPELRRGQTALRTRAGRLRIATRL
jgi:hypothetical protein